MSCLEELVRKRKFSAVSPSAARLEALSEDYLKTLIYLPLTGISPVREQKTHFRSSQCVCCWQARISLSNFRKIRHIPLRL